MLLRTGLPPALPAEHDTRRFPGVLEFNLSVRIACYAAFAAAAKTITDVPNAPDGAGNSSPYNSRTEPVNLKR